MTLKQIVAKAKDKSNFKDLKAYISFCDLYLSFVSDNLQAIIVSQNENHYQFYQYKKEGNYQITRPINSNLMYDAVSFKVASTEFLKIMSNIKTIDKNDNSIRQILNNSTYTIQQSIGSALDGLPAGQSNTARKLNGDLFEHFIRLIIREIGIDCKSGVVQIPIIVKDEKLFNQVSIELGALTWPNGADLDPAWLHEEIRGNKTWSVPDCRTQ